MENLQFIKTNMETDVVEITPELAKHILATDLLIYFDN